MPKIVSTVILVLLLVGMFSFSRNLSVECIVSATSKVSTSMLAYENVTTHEGDLIVNGTQTLVIENCTYIQRGNIRVSDNAKVKVRNTILRIDPQDYWHQFEFSVDSQATLEMLNSTANVPKGAWLYCGGNSNVNITQSSLDGMPVGAGGRSNVIIDNSSCDRGGVVLSEDCRITVLNSTLSSITLNLVPSSNSVIEGLKPGYFDYLRLHQNQSGVDVGYDLTVVNTSVRDWCLSLAQFDVNVVVSDSALTSIWVWYVGTTAKIQGIQDGRYYEHLDINNLTLIKTSVSSFTFAVSDSSVELRNTKAELHLFSGISNVSIYDSKLHFLARSTEMGVLFLNESSLVGSGLLDSRLYIYGNVTHVEWYQDWFSSNVTRNYSILAEDAGGNPVINVELTLLDSNGTVFWNGVSETLGRADFNLTFTDTNYTDTLKLGAFKEGFYNVTKELSLLSSTPVSLDLVQKPIGDINQDHVVNILDVFIIARAFGSRPGDSNWDATADLDKNGIIDILDVFAVARDYGKVTR